MKCILIIFLFLFISCFQDHVKKEYFSNGNIRIKYNIVKNRKEGKCEEFFENGKFKSVTFWNNDKLNGLAHYYYQNGVIKVETSWKNGKLDGLYKEYYPSGKIKLKGNFYKGYQSGKFEEFNSKGSLKKIFNFVLLKDSSYLNDFYTFDNNGNIIYNQSNFFTIDYEDTISYGEKFCARIYLKSPYFSESTMIVFFDIPDDTINYRRIVSTNYEINYIYMPKKIGKNCMSGFIDEIENRKGINSDETSMRRLYFNIEYFVKAK